MGDASESRLLRESKPEVGCYACVTGKEAESAWLQMTTKDASQRCALLCPATTFSSF